MIPKHTSWVLNALLQDLDQLLIAEGTVFTSLQATKSSLRRLLVDGRLEPCDPLQQLGHRNAERVLPWEDLSVKLFGPLVITLGDGRMEAVEKIEFTGDLVPSAPRHAIDRDTRVESPRRLGVVETGNATDITIFVSLPVIARLGVGR